MLVGRGTGAVELSALRSHELEPLLESIGNLRLDSFRHIALHMPSDMTGVAADQVVSRVIDSVPAQWPIVVHPDSLSHVDHWNTLGARLCIENMDKSKATGRTASELGPFFDRLPEASMCLDLAHARQIDPTMSHAVELIHAFTDRIAQIHLSDINSKGRHLPLSTAAIYAYRHVAPLLPRGIPVIIESVVKPGDIDHELVMARAAMDASGDGRRSTGAASLVGDGG